MSANAFQVVLDSRWNQSERNKGQIQTTVHLREHGPILNFSYALSTKHSALLLPPLFHVEHFTGFLTPFLTLTPDSRPLTPDL